MTMNFPTYSTLSSLISAADLLLPEVDVVSFDLFDTLLIRRVHDPDMVKRPIAQYIASLASRHGIALGAERVQHLRDTIEAAQRKETGEKFADHEACYPIFMEALLREIFDAQYSDELLSKVTEYELKMENSMLVPRHELVSWLKQCKRAGKRIFIISDMYLPGSHLEKLVEHAGFLEDVDEVLSSADTFLAKASGLGYSHVAEKFTLDTARWLHIGDNPISDGLRAGEAGLKPLIIHDYREDQRKSIIKRYCNYGLGKPFWRGRALQQLMAPLEAENCGQDPLYIDGYNFIGPVIGIFLQRLASLCRKNRVGKIFFLSREGWTFQKYWEAAMEFIAPAGDLPPHEYLYVSRMALAGASCAVQGLTRTNADIAFLPPGNRDFTDVCRIFSLDAESFRGHLDRYDLTPETCLSHIHDGYEQENRKRFEALLEDSEFQDEVRKQCQDSSIALQRYLEDVGFFSYERVAVVDIGWLGTIQRFLFESIAHREDCPKCLGYLFGATRGVPFADDERNKLEGIIYDRDKFDLAASTLFYARDIFEEACRAPYPTLNGYRPDGDGYKLEFRHTDDDIGKAELEQDSYFAPLQRGILDSAARFGAASALLGYEYEDYKPWVNNLLVSRLAFARTKEIQRIRNRHHLDDFHGRKKAKAEFYKVFSPLWERTEVELKFRPFLRIQSFFRHLRERINE